MPAGSEPEATLERRWNFWRRERVRGEGSGAALSVRLRLGAERSLRPPRHLGDRLGRHHSPAARLVSWLPDRTLLDAELHRFTSHDGATLESLAMGDAHLQLAIRNRTHRLEVEALEAEGGVLHAPYEHQMIARFADTMTSGIDLRLSRLADGAPVYEGHGRHACFEAQGDLGSLLDGP